ncbi:hypothetical protein C3K47_03230 [Solitalea longa]|uniref:RES domain-containing protein n=1 Tax=Solitalea longa TaxID=2079460 RepID=A0A2S5A7D7_9SPHI|nr:RES family NAD+ phosphorylase [Solitalea longa]POY38426.1 hypothetical protein C3K47_03230 [Solitalea longa]
MNVYHIARNEYINDLSGAGSRLFGGRWNSIGTSLIYTSSTRALSVLELLAHLPATQLPVNYSVIHLSVPEEHVINLDLHLLPLDWKKFPSPFSLKFFGDDFVRQSGGLVLKVPSALVEDEFNYLINPGHADMKKVEIVKVKPFAFDDRLF